MSPSRAHAMREIGNTVSTALAVTPCEVAPIRARPTPQAESRRAQILTVGANSGSKSPVGDGTAPNGGRKKKCG